MGASEPEGFREYVLARRLALSRAAYLMTGDRHLAEDLVQSVLARVWPRWERVSRMEDADAYVHRMLMSTYLTWWRRKWRGELPHGRLPDEAGYDPVAGLADRAAVLAAIRTLPPRQRAVIVLRFYFDRTETQSAEALGCSVGTVKSQTAKALAGLRIHFGVEESAARKAVAGAESSAAAPVRAPRTRSLPQAARLPAPATGGPGDDVPQIRKESKR